MNFRNPVRTGIPKLSISREAVQKKRSTSAPDLSRIDLSRGIGDQARMYLNSSTQRGIPVSMITATEGESAFTVQDWSQFLHLSEDTLRRYEKLKKIFGPMQSDRILQILMLDKRGIEVFGEAQRFSNWVRTNIPALGGARPFDLIESSFGISLLMDELGRIEHGIFA